MQVAGTSTLGSGACLPYDVRADRGRELDHENDVAFRSASAAPLHPKPAPRRRSAALGPLISERTIAALASEASGQRGHFISARAQTPTLYVNSWGGSFTAAQEVAYFKPFTALTGIQIPHRHTGLLRQDQGAGADRPL